MTALARAFVAVVPPAGVLDAVDRALDEVRAHAPVLVPEIRWVRREQWHLTLAFLGHVPDDDALVAALREVIVDVAPFGISLQGAGAYPSARRARIVWLGVGAGSAELTALAGRVAGASAVLGAVEGRDAFTPHLTLGRVRRPGRVDRLVEALGAHELGRPWTADSLLVVESDTRPDGAVHTERHRLALGG